MGKKERKSVVVAGREGFEPPEALTSTVFKTAAIDHSAISRKCAKSIAQKAKIQALCLNFGGDTRI